MRSREKNGLDVVCLKEPEVRSVFPQECLRTTASGYPEALGTH